MKAFFGFRSLKSPRVKRLFWSFQQNDQSDESNRLNNEPLTEKTWKTYVFLMLIPEPPNVHWERANEGQKYGT